MSFQSSYSVVASCRQTCDDQLCGICCREYRSKVVAPCNHSFCSFCVLVMVRHEIDFGHGKDHSPRNLERHSSQKPQSRVGIEGGSRSDTFSTECPFCRQTINPEDLVIAETGQAWMQHLHANRNTPFAAKRPDDQVPSSPSSGSRTSLVGRRASLGVLSDESSGTRVRCARVRVPLPSVPASPILHVSARTVKGDVHDLLL